MADTLADVLGSFLSRSHSSLNRLAKLSGVPKQTLANWMQRRILRPRRWQDLVRVAAAMHLTEAEANALLHAGGHADLEALRRDSGPAGLALFDAWAKPSTRPLVPPPFQAITDLTDFVGREAEITRLRQSLLSSGRVTVCGVRGMAGVGKTALAAHLAYAVRDAFPDGVLWARLDVSDTLSILAQFADAYGKDVRHQEDVESRAAVVRDLLNRKRALIVLDNAESSVQVRPLLPPSTSPSAVLVTSRNHLAVADGWLRVDLEPFGEETGEALEFFEKRLGKPRTRQQREILLEIADQMGYLPLALAIVAGQLADAPEPAFAQARDTLRLAGHRLQTLQRDDYNVRLSFDVSFASLRRDDQVCFEALGVFDSEDFSTEVVAAVTEWPAPTALGALQRLERRSLIQISRAGRWRLHPLLRDYARERLSQDPASARTAETRMVEHYLQAIERLGTAGAGALRVDAGNLLAVLRNEHLSPLLLVRSVSVLQPVLTRWGLNRELNSVGLRQRLQTAAATLDEKRELPAWLFRLAVIECETGTDYERAEALGRQAAILAQQAGAWEVAARCLNYLSTQAWYQGQRDREDAFAAQAEAIARQHDLKPILASIQHNRGTREMERGRFEVAEAHYRHFAAYCRKEKRTQWLATCLDNLGSLAYRQQKWTEADAYFAESLAIAEKEEGVRPTDVLTDRGLNALAAGKPTEAEALVDEALQILRRHDQPRSLAEVLLARGDVAAAVGDPAAAEAFWLEGLPLAQAMGLKRLLSGLSGRLGLAFANRGEIDQAEACLRDALRVAREIDHEALQALALWGQAQLALKRGDREQARRLAMESVVLYESVRDWHSQDVRAWLDRLA